MNRVIYLGDTFTALFSYRKNTETMNTLLNSLNNSELLNLKLFKYSNSESKYGLKWDIHLNDELRLEGVDLFSIFIGKNMCQLESMVRWDLFLTSNEVRNKCREICYELSKILSFPIYSPSSFDSLSYVFEGKDINYVLKNLKKKYGDPLMMVSFNKNMDSSIYLIDHFEGFSS